MNVYLVGLRGSGKTTIGGLLAERLGWEFADQDAIVTERAGRSISDIFAESGEKEFRRIETEVLDEIAKRDKTVVATGGGVVLSEENRRIMRDTGLVIHLDASPEILAQRVLADASSTSSRPPLTEADDALEEMKEVARQRRPLYEAARHAAVSADIPPEAAAERMEQILRSHTP